MLSTVVLLFSVILTLLLVAFGLLYLGLVGMTYRTDGAGTPLRIDLGDPVRSAERFLVWSGVKAVAAFLRSARAVLDALFEASAEIGDWYLRRRGRNTQSELLSRFL